MKKIYTLVLLLPLLALGQQPNYVKTTAYRQATATSLASPQPEQAAQQVTYLDGLGRPIQQVASKQSATGKDIVTHIGYDALGRQAREYLPYASASSGAGYNANALAETLAFYNTPAYGNTQNPYSEKLFEASPMNRVLKQAAPGNAWVLGGGHEIRTDYLANTAQDAVGLYRANASWDAAEKIYRATITKPGDYAPLQLYKTVTKDENWTSGKANTTEEYRNKSGQVVLKRAYGESVENGTSAFLAHDTYYVYDQFGNLALVIPPLAKGSIAKNSLDGLCYQYHYDSRNRLAEKKLPGKQWEYIAYDKLDRVIATGPANSPFGAASKGWNFTKYDALGRPAYTGWYSGHQADAGGRAAMQALLDNATVLWETSTAAATVDNISIGYSNNAFPTNAYHLLSISYYDGYGYPGAPAVPASVLSQDVLADAKGLPTGTWTRVLTSGGEFMGDMAATFYDKKGRPVRSHLASYLGGHTIADSQVDFAGQVLSTMTTHRLAAGSADLVTVENFTYSPQGSLLTHEHQAGSISQVLARNSYDELGQLIRKGVGGLPGNPALQQVDYSYNVRGWLTGINPWMSELPGDPTDLFTFAITYDSPASAQPLFNGNISETYWRSYSDWTYRKYDYQYDALNRLTSATYSKPYDSYPLTHAYDEALKYDRNGNITQLYRNGNSDGDTGMEIDDLAYGYEPSSPNRLARVTDASLDGNGFADGTNTGDDYAYDDNGNMVSDLNKGITSITYNHLNLPVQISFGYAQKIEYLYDAAGAKKRKSVTANEPGTVNPKTENIDYVGGYQYKKGVLQFFPTAEGYVRNTEGVLNYVFQYRDHLGNIRMSYAEEPSAPGTLTIIEENHYYPFGLKHTNYNSGQMEFAKGEASVFLKDKPCALCPEPVMPLWNNYKYNGKEFQDELGFNLYDYGARNYDPAIGRWMNIDPLAEDYVNISPYTYTANSPVIFLDPNGKEIYLYYTTEGNSKKDDEMFWSAAMTRAFDFLSNKNFGGNDIFKVTRVKDLASIKNDAESFISENSKKYGKTKEVGIWSHAGLDGPVGTVATSKNALSVMENKQMSLEGWGNIDFNWAKDASAYFYGCLTGLDPSGDKKAFTTELSALSNFKDVTVYGQTNYSYPSQYANSRRPTGDQLDGNFSPSSPTYMVGGNRFQQPGLRLFSDTKFEAHPMSGSVNGKVTVKMYQFGKNAN